MSARAGSRVGRALWVCWVVLLVAFFLGFALAQTCVTLMRGMHDPTHGRWPTGSARGTRF